MTVILAMLGVAGVCQGVLVLRLLGRVERLEEELRWSLPGRRVPPGANGERCPHCGDLLCGGLCHRCFTVREPAP